MNDRTARGTRRDKEPPLPTRDEVLTFIRGCDTPPGKREIARAFHLRGQAKTLLKALLKDLEQEGLIEKRGKNEIWPAGQLPPVTVVEIVGPDIDGELLAKPSKWQQDETPPTIYMEPEKRGRTALKPGDRVLARLKRDDDGSYEGRTIRVIGAPPKQVLGVYQMGSRGGRLQPTDRRNKSEFVVKSADAGGAAPGELVLAAVKDERAKLGLKEVTVIERLGRLEDTRALSLVAIHEHGLPTSFSDATLAAAEAAGPAPLDKRSDLRDLPLVTIDGADARDFDDAVWAEVDGDPKNPGGWHLIVAIADVSHYVRPGDALDREARARGNSTYFPDRVIPMLPEALSNGWCSLVPGEDRPCLAAHLWLDAAGRLKAHRFERALMHSAARLTYEAAQTAWDEKDAPDNQGGAKAELLTILKPLYGAFEALTRARDARGTLDLDLQESQVVFDEKGEIDSIQTRQRLDSHRLIEEFMIAANVAAAEALESRQQPCMYRVHDVPAPEKLEALRESLSGLGIKFARGQSLKPETFNRILKQVKSTPSEALVNSLVLRSQSQAAYSPDNLGHFGLALRRYAHFTSPIRRYSDLLVHRALISSFKLGPGGLSKTERADFTEIAEQISATERRSQLAERDTMDRFTAAYLSRHLGEVVVGRIRGVTRFGLFVQIPESGADGLVPVSSLPDDYYDHDELDHRLIGRRWGRSYQLGETVTVRIKEADALTGGLVLALVESDEEGSTEPRRGRGTRPPSSGSKQGHGSGSKPAKKPSKKAGKKPKKKPGKVAARRAAKSGQSSDGASKAKKPAKNRAKKRK